MIHGLIGPIDAGSQRFSFLVLADTDRNMDVWDVGSSVFSNAQSYPFCNGHGFRFGCCGKQQDEFLSAPSSGCVIDSAARFELFCGVLQDTVAHVVTIVVINFLEMVNIDKEYGCGIF